MKKHLIIAFLFYGFYLLANAQLPIIPRDLSKFIVLDSASYVITYDVSIMNDTMSPEKTIKDVMTLQVGRRMSKSFSSLLYQADSSSNALFKKGEKNVPWFQEIVPPIIVYKNYPANKNTIVYRAFLSAPIFKYEEPASEIDWELLPERKILLGYNCQKATGTFRGRTYTAWFTPDIPLREGPYKFGGLPGLILEISDTKDHYVFNCIGIQKVQDIIPIVFWDWKMQKTTRAKLNTLIRRCHAEPAATSESMGIKIRFKERSGEDMTPERRYSQSYPYNPIELE